jgi:hypothetical protein
MATNRKKKEEEEEEEVGRRRAINEIFGWRTKSSVLGFRF